MTIWCTTLLDFVFFVFVLVRVLVLVLAFVFCLCSCFVFFSPCTVHGVYADVFVAYTNQ